jgi:acylphosphatase
VNNYYSDWQIKPMTKHFEIIVHGRVQGVGFRYSASNEAMSLNLQGWVENLPDGSVRTSVQGDESDCQAYIQWCKKGPGSSRVDRIEISEQPPVDLKGFSVRY